MTGGESKLYRESDWETDRCWEDQEQTDKCMRTRVRNRCKVVVYILVLG